VWTENAVRSWCEEPGLAAATAAAAINSNQALVLSHRR
jgi:hypothetical protein